MYTRYMYTSLRTMYDGMIRSGYTQPSLLDTIPINGDSKHHGEYCNEYDDDENKHTTLLPRIDYG